MLKLVNLSNPCPNCGGQLEKQGTRYYYCPYCESKFEAEYDQGEGNTEDSAKASDTESVKGGSFARPDWFEYMGEYESLLKYPTTRECMSAFERCVNKLGTSREILEYIRGVDMLYSQTSLTKSNEVAMEKFLAKCRSYLDANETPVLYVDLGILSKGKSGMLITGKRTLIKEWALINLPHDEIDFMSFDMKTKTPGITLNGKASVSVYGIGSEKLEGAITALIAALAFEKSPGRKRIIVHDSAY